MRHIKFPKLTLWRGILAVILVLGLYAMFVRLTKGLGVSTNMSDNFPWGLWIGFNVMVGVGLAAGGFVITGAVYIFGLKKLKPIARPAVLTAFLGYVLAAVGLFFELGQPHRIWHPMVNWNPHSVLFEVAWCVMLYITVLFLEFSPSVLERFHLKRTLKIMKVLTIPLVILGVILSTLHQSAVGSLFLIFPDKLHSLWYSSYLPVFYFVSAIGAGLAVVIFESFMSNRAFKKGLELELLAGIGRVIVVVLGLYLLMKVLDLSNRGNLSLIFEGSQESTLFLAEIGLGVILPIILFLIPKVRQNETGLFFSALFVILGFIMNRMNVCITGMQRGMGGTYFPSWMEVAIGATLVAMGFAIFALAAKYLPVFPRREAISEAEVEHAPLQQLPTAPEALATSATKGGLASWGGFAILLSLGILFGIGILTLNISQKGKPKESVPQSAEVSIPRKVVVQDLKLPADYVFPEGEDSPGKVTFRHTTHVDDEDPNCESCHPELFKILEPGTLTTGVLSMEEMYDGKQCGVCHNGQKGFSVEDDCSICHEE